MKKIIFVDDDPTIQDVINLILEDDYDVEIFSKGEPLFNDEFTVPNLFLLDRQLSGVDGLDLCRHLKAQERTRHVPVIIISAAPNILRWQKRRALMPPLRNRSESGSCVS